MYFCNTGVIYSLLVVVYFEDDSFAEKIYLYLLITRSNTTANSARKVSIFIHNDVYD